MWRWTARRSSDRQGQPGGWACGTKRLAPRHRWTPSGVCALGVAACVRGRTGAGVPCAGYRPLNLCGGAAWTT
ncbi:hypothetical protein [Bellilinea caldifistulae]|uniref:hypothetical protein n=1 Tax=Bellilinea caldifistulae TaxID=360411 RepID=UPI0011AE7DB3|nr:hypothetical protein [Bellilinea caldifistulae]